MPMQGTLLAGVPFVQNSARTATLACNRQAARSAIACTTTLYIPFSATLSHSVPGIPWGVQVPLPSGEHLWRKQDW